ncbi:MAG: hypothetical protein ISS45_13480 [Candidatus Omnitrophica bacterium]|nr:hypothetical protein [Candidatus Omnitrophota bacterium]
MRLKSRLEEIYCFEIGGLRIGIELKALPGRLFIPETYRTFQVEACEFDIFLKIFLAQQPDISLRQLLFDVQPMWQIHETNTDERVFIHKSPLFKQPYLLGVFDPDFSKGRIYIEPYLDLESAKNRTWPFLFFPLDELLTIQLLSQKQGTLIHSCGINLDDEGVLFVGASGAGKSTLSSFFESSRILSDDRVIIRKEIKGFRIFGTPWCGTGRIYSTKSLPLSKIFFLRHGTRNTKQPLRPAEVFRLLVALSFLPFWDQKGLENCLKIYEEISQTVECYSLEFLPTQEIRDIITEDLGVTGMKNQK